MNRKLIVSATDAIKSANESVTKKFVFHNSKITQLKAMAAVQGVNSPTTVQVISALISKRSIAAAAQNPPSSLFHFANTSPKMAPRSTETCVGNLRALSEQIKKRNMELKRSLKEFEISRCGRNNYVEGEEVFVLNGMSSGDGIEAVVSLEKGSMATFECDKQLLQFASLQQNSL